MVRTIVTHAAHLVLLLFLLGTAGCSGVSDFAETASSLSRLETIVESEVGGKVKARWSVHNNIVTVNIVFQQLPAMEMEINEFKRRVTTVIEENSESRIGKIAITI